MFINQHKHAEYLKPSKAASPTSHQSRLEAAVQILKGILETSIWFVEIFCPNSSLHVLQHHKPLERRRWKIPNSQSKVISGLHLVSFRAEGRFSLTPNHKLGPTSPWSESLIRRNGSLISTQRSAFPPLTFSLVDRQVFQRHITSKMLHLFFSCINYCLKKKENNKCVWIIMKKMSLMPLHVAGLCLISVCCMSFQRFLNSPHNDFWFVYIISQQTELKVWAFLSRLLLQRAARPPTCSAFISYI